MAAPTVPVGDPARPGRWHRIRSGESLYAIAAANLGRDATSSEIAREVHRLWSLNAERIGTGTPDMILAGQRLRLR